MKPYTLTVSAHNGLSNRLMAMLSGIAIAEATQRNFRMLWIRNGHCGADFSELFSNAWNIVTIDESEFYTHHNYPWFDDRDLLTDRRRSIAVHHCGWLIRPAFYPTHKPVFKRTVQLLDELEPLPTIAGRIDEFRSQHFRDAMIGVHVRLGDLNGSNPNFSDAVDDFLAAVDARLDARPDAGILLCSDDGAPRPNGTPTATFGITKIFEKRYGTRVVHPIARSMNRQNHEAIQDAVADLLLLRATHCIVGTQKSTFSRLAAVGTAGPHAFISVTPHIPAPTQRRKSNRQTTLSRFLHHARKILKGFVTPRS